jgi:hypothetical protein
MEGEAVSLSICGVPRTLERNGVGVLNFVAKNYLLQNEQIIIIFRQNWHGTKS